MTYRDENEALRAQVGALQDEVADLKEEIVKRDHPAPISVAAPPTEFADRVADAQHKAREEAKRSRRAARLASRPARVHVVRGQGSLRVVIERELVWDKVRTQAPMGIVFALVVLGPFVVVPLAWVLHSLPFAVAILLAIVLYAVALGIVSLAWAALTRGRWVLDVTSAGDFVLREGSSARPRLAGRAGKLETRLSDSDPAALGCVRFDDGRQSIVITQLTSGDLELLRGALPGHARLTSPEDASPEGD